MAEMIGRKKGLISILLVFGLLAGTFVNFLIPYSNTQAISSTVRDPDKALNLLYSYYYIKKCTSQITFNSNNIVYESIYDASEESWTEGETGWQQVGSDNASVFGELAGGTLTGIFNINNEYSVERLNASSFLDSFNQTSVYLPNYTYPVFIPANCGEFHNKLQHLFPGISDTALIGVLGYKTVYYACYENDGGRNNCAGINGGFGAIMTYYSFDGNLDNVSVGPSGYYGAGGNVSSSVMANITSEFEKRYGQGSVGDALSYYQHYSIMKTSCTDNSAQSTQQTPIYAYRDGNRYYSQEGSKISIKSGGAHSILGIDNEFHDEDCQTVFNHMNDLATKVNSGGWWQYVVESIENNITAPTPPTTDPGSGSGSSGTGAGDSDACYDATEGWGWVACPGITWAAKAIDWIVEKLTAGLSINLLIGSDNTGAVTGLWQGILPIANIALAIVFLIIIYSTATSIGLSNYSIKKMMPRLIAVAIAVNISFYICAALADVSNIIGDSAEIFIGGHTNSLPNNMYQGGVEEVISNLAVSVAVFVGLFIALLSSFGAAILALLIIVIAVVIRQVVLVLLVIISPLAILCYLLPNTNKWFKSWLNNYVRLLFVYPLFMIAWSGTRLVANLIYHLDIVGLGLDVGWKWIFIALLNIAPLFIIIPIFKLSGGLMGKITSQLESNKALQGASKLAGGAFDRGRSALANSNNRFARAVGAGLTADKSIQTILDSSKAQTERDFTGARARFSTNKFGRKIIPSTQVAASQRALEKLEDDEVAAANTDLNYAHVYDEATGTNRKISEAEKVELALTGNISRLGKDLKLSDDKGRVIGNGKMKLGEAHRMAAIKHAAISSGDAELMLAQSQFETDNVSIRNALSQRAGEKLAYHTGARFGEADALTLGDALKSGVSFHSGTKAEYENGKIKPSTGNSSIKYADAVKSLIDKKIEGGKFVQGSSGPMETQFLGALAAAGKGDGQAMQELGQLVANLSPEQLAVANENTDKAQIIKLINDFNSSGLDAGSWSTWAIGEINAGAQKIGGKNRSIDLDVKDKNGNSTNEISIT